jgi:hypothetical protein
MPIAMQIFNHVRGETELGQLLREQPNEVLVSMLGLLMHEK